MDLSQEIHNEGAELFAAVSPSFIVLFGGESPHGPSHFNAFSAAGDAESRAD